MERTTKADRDPKISVIVPLYNSGTTLRRCIDSLLAQDYSSYEVLLIDDGSTDCSGELCDSYAEQDGRIKVVHQPNKGVSAARNIGMEMATGEWIAFCDSDDSVEPDWLSGMAAETATAELVVCGYRVYYPGHQDSPEMMTLDRRSSYVDSDKVLESLMSRRLFQFIWNKLFMKSVIMKSKLHFDESYRIFEDELFVLDYLSRVTDVVCIPDCTYNYYLPDHYMTRYDFGIDAFQEVVERIYHTVASVPGRVRLPSLLEWYKVALVRFTEQHTYEESIDRLVFARKLAVNFHDGMFDNLRMRFCNRKCLYRYMRRKGMEYRNITRQI